MQPYRQNSRIGLCGALIALAFLIRVVAASGLDAATAGLFTYHGQSADPPQQTVVSDTAPTLPEQPEDPEDPALLPEVSEPAPEDSVLPEDPDLPSGETAGISLHFSDAEADAIEIKGGCTYEVDKRALLQAPLELTPASDGPQVLIIHTHTTESYRPEAGWEYEQSDTLRTEDTNYSVVRVGRELADTLELLGIETLHDETIHDVPSYNDSYARTLEDIQADLAANPSIRLVLDVHRDAIADEQGNYIPTAVTVDGRSTAQIMLVVGTDQGGLEHPDWQKNLSCALKVQAILNRNAPGVCVTSTFALSGSTSTPRRAPCCWRSALRATPWPRRFPPRVWPDRPSPSCSGPRPELLQHSGGRPPLRRLRRHLPSRGGFGGEKIKRLPLRGAGREAD